MAVPTILLLPDDPWSGLRALSNLQTFGYDLLVASSTPEALGLLEAHPRILPKLRRNQSRSSAVQPRQ